MKKPNKLLVLLAAGIISATACTCLASCGDAQAAQVNGVYHCQKLIASPYGMRIQNGVVEDLTLYSDSTYALSIYYTTWRSADIDSGSPYVNYGVQALTVFGEYTVTGSTEADEASAATTTVSLGDITRSIYYCTAATNEEVAEHVYLGDSNDFDEATRAAALNFFKLSGTTVTVDESSFTMTTGAVGVTLLSSSATLEVAAGN